MRQDDELDPRPFAELRTEAIRLAGRLSAGQRDTDARFAGRDGDRIVEIVVDGDAQVVDVHIDRDWRDRLGPSGLGPAVLGALTDAVNARALTWVERIDERVPPVPRAAAPDRHSGSPGHQTSPDTVGSMRDMLDLLDRFEAQLTGLNDALERRLAEETVVRSGDRAVTVAIRGGAVADVQIDSRWLANASSRQIAASVREALRSAHDRASRSATEVVAGFASIGEVRALAERPEDLLRKLGLLG